MEGGWEVCHLQPLLNLLEELNQAVGVRRYCIVGNVQIAYHTRRKEGCLLFMREPTKQWAHEPEKRLLPQASIIGTDILTNRGPTHSQTTIRYPFSTPPHGLQLCNSIIYGHNVWKNKHTFCSVNLYYSSELTAHLQCHHTFILLIHSNMLCLVWCSFNTLICLSDSFLVWYWYILWDYTSTPFTPPAVYCSLSDTLFGACTHYDWVMSPTTR